MRDNGPAPKRLHISRSRDNGLTWSDVQDSQIPNPGAGADLVTLSNGHWVLAFNDTERGRHSLAVSTTRDEGQIWSKPRHLEQDPKKTTSFAYPAIVQAKDGALHVVYSYHGRKDNGEAHKTIKHARFNEAWILDQQ
ncbi:MAG: exo-alpha-sialidase [Planctomycetes bacterium]|nr:exo-alpha-sialidase [Planctomycetota bacterium]